MNRPSNRTLVFYTLFIFLAAFAVSVAVVLLTLKPWAKNEKLDIPIELPPEQIPNHIDIFTRDGTQIKTNDYSKYTVTRIPLENSFTLFEYKFKQGAQCVQVKYDSKDVWKYGEFMIEHGYPQVILFNTTTKSALFEFDSNTFHSYKYEDNEWKRRFAVRALERLSIDLYDPEQTDKYTIEEAGDTKTYKPKDDFFFNSLSVGGKNLWNTDEVRELSNKVKLSKVTENLKLISVFLVNGSMKNFYVKKKNLSANP